MSRFGEAVQTATDDYVAGKFPTTERGKEAQYRSDNRHDTSAQENGVSDESTAGKRETGLAINRARTHLLTGRPDPELSLGNSDFQEAAFEVNSVTKAEGESKEMLKSAFDAVTRAEKEAFKDYDLPADEKEIDGLVKLGHPATTKMDRAKLFTPTEIKKFVTLDNPKKNMHWEVGGAQNDLKTNTSKIFEDIYGSDLNRYIFDLVYEKSNSSNTEGGNPSADFRTNIKDLLTDIVSGPDISMPPEAYNEDAVSLLLTQTVQILLIENPDQAAEILDQLAQSGELDLDSISGFRSLFEKNLIQHTLDSLEANNPDLFDTENSAAPNRVALAADNRDKLHKRLIDTSVPPLTTNLNLIKLDSAGTSITTVPKQLDAQSQWKDLTGTADIKLNSNSAAAIPSASPTNFDTYIDNNAFLGDSFESNQFELNIILSRLGKTLTKNPNHSKAIFNDIFTHAMATGTVSGGDSLTRTSAFAKSAERLRAQVTAGVADAASINALIESVTEMASPELLMQKTQEKVIREMHDKLYSLSPFTGELAGLNVAQLGSDAIFQAESGNIDSTFFERLSTIAAALPETERKIILSQIRALANIEIIKEIASDSADGSTSGVIYTQNLAALMNRFVFNDSGTATPATSEQLSEQLIDLMHAKPADEEALKIKIGAFPKMDAYVKSLLPVGTTPEAELSLNGYRSRGIIDGKETAFTKAHQLLGIVRRGSETGEWFDLRGKTNPEIKTYIVDTFGITDGSEQLDQALIRFKAVTNGAATLPFDVPRIIEAARDGSNTEYGEHFTNSMRVFRGYIISGGELEQSLKQEVHQKIDKFMGSLQTQAHPELASLKGDALAERNRVLGIEEQRATVYDNYEALNNKSGIEKFFAVVKKALPRIGKALIFPAIAMVPTLIPALGILAPGVVIAAAGLRILALVGIATKGLPQVFKAVKQGNWKAGVAAAAGFGVNALAVSFLPPSLGLMLGVGAVEAIGVVTANEFALSKEAENVVKSFTKYESAANQFIEDIDATTDIGRDQLEKLTRALNIDIIYSAGITIDGDATKLAIKAARKTARDTNNMSLLREYGKLMEHHVEASTQTLRDENLETKRLRDEIQQIIVSYGVGSGLGKIGTRVAKDGWVGATSEEGFWNSAKGAVLGGLGLSGLELGNNDETETTNENGSKLAAIDKSLEDNYDSVATENEFVNKGDNNILGLTESADGTETYALVDADGDGGIDYLIGIETDPSNPGQFALSDNVQGMVADDGTSILSDNPAILKTQVVAFSGNDDVTISPAPDGADDSVQAIVEIGDKDYVLVENEDGVNELYEAKLEYVTNTTTSTTAGAEGSTSYENLSVTAGEDTLDNQWSMTQGLLEEASPDMSQAEIHRHTANLIAEANRDNSRGLYDAMDRSRNAQTVISGDKLSLESIKEVAPNSFAQFEQTASHEGVTIATQTPVTGNTPSETSTTTEKVLTVKSISDTSEFAFEQGEQSLQSGVIFSSGPGGNHLIFNQGQVVATVANGSATPTDTTGDDSTVAQDDDDAEITVKAPVAKEASPTLGFTVTVEQPETTPVDQSSILTQLGIVDGSTVIAGAVDTPINDVQTTVATSPTETDLNIPASNDPTDMIEINNRMSADFLKGFFADGKGEQIFESTVDKIYIRGEGLEHGEVELDIDEIDVIRIDPEDKIVYRLADGTKQTIDLHDRKVDFVFKGDEDRIPMDGGNLLEKMTVATEKLDQFTTELDEFATTTSATLSQAGDSVENMVKVTNNTVEQVVEQWKTIYQQFAEWNPDEIKFDPSPGMGNDYPLPGVGTIMEYNGEKIIMDYLVANGEKISYGTITSAGINEISYINPEGNITTIEILQKLPVYDNNGTLLKTIDNPNPNVYGIASTLEGDPTPHTYNVTFPIGKNMAMHRNSLGELVPSLKIEESITTD